MNARTGGACVRGRHPGRGGADGAATSACPRRPLAVSTPPSAQLCGQAAVTCQERPHRPREDKETVLQRGPAGLPAALNTQAPAPLLGRQGSGPGPA